MRVQSGKLTFDGDKEVLVRARVAEDGSANFDKIRTAVAKAFEENREIASVEVNLEGEVTRAKDKEGKRVTLEGTIEHPALQGRVLVVPNAAGYVPEGETASDWMIIRGISAVAGAIGALGARIVEAIKGHGDQELADALVAYEMRPGVALVDQAALDQVKAADIVRRKAEFLEGESETLFQTLGLDKQMLAEEAKLHLEAANFMDKAAEIRDLPPVGRGEKVHELHGEICEALKGLADGEKKLLAFDWRIQDEMVMLLVEVTHTGESNTVRFFNCSDRLAELFPSVGLPLEAFVPKEDRGDPAVGMVVKAAEQMLGAPRNVQNGYEFQGISQEDLEVALLPLLILQTAQLEPDKAEETSFFLLRWIKAFLGKLGELLSFAPQAIGGVLDMWRAINLDMPGVGEVGLAELMVEGADAHLGEEQKAKMEDLAKQLGVDALDPTVERDLVGGVFAKLRNGAQVHLALGALKEAKQGVPCSKVLQVRDRILHPNEAPVIKFKYLLDRFNRMLARVEPFLASNPTYRELVLELTDRIEAQAIKHSVEIFGANREQDLLALATRLNEVREAVRGHAEAAELSVCVQVEQSGQFFPGQLEVPTAFVSPQVEGGAVASSNFEAQTVQAIDFTGPIEETETAFEAWIEQTTALLNEDKHETLRDVSLQMVAKLPRPEIANDAFFDNLLAGTKGEKKRVEWWQEQVQTLGDHLYCSIYHRMGPYAESNIHRWSLYPDELRAAVRLICIQEKLSRHVDNPAAHYLNDRFFDHTGVLERLIEDPWLDDASGDRELIHDLAYLEQRRKAADGYRSSVTLGGSSIWNERELLDEMVATAEADGVDLIAGLNDRLRREMEGDIKRAQESDNFDPDDITRIEERIKRQALLYQDEYQEYVPQGLRSLRAAVTHAKVLIAPTRSLMPRTVGQGLRAAGAVVGQAISRAGDFIDAALDGDVERIEEMKDEFAEDMSAIPIKGNAGGLRHCKSAEVKFEPLEVPGTCEHYLCLQPFGLRAGNENISGRGMQPHSYEGGRSVLDKAFRRDVSEGGVREGDIGDVLATETALKGYTKPVTVEMQLDRAAVQKSASDKLLSYKLPNKERVYHLPGRAKWGTYDAASSAIHSITAVLGVRVEKLSRPELQRDIEKRLLRPGVVEALCATDDRFRDSLVEFLNRAMSEAAFTNDLPTQLFLGRLAFRIKGRLEAMAKESADYYHVDEATDKLPDYRALVREAYGSLKGDGEGVEAHKTLVHQHYLYEMMERPRGEITEEMWGDIFASYCALQGLPPAKGWEEPALHDRIGRWMCRNLAEWQEKMTDPSALLAPVLELNLPEFTGDRAQVVWEAKGFPQYSCRVGIGGEQVEVVLDLATGHLFIDGKANRVFVPSDVVDKSPGYRAVFGEVRMPGTYSVHGNVATYHLEHEGRHYQVQHDQKANRVTLLWKVEIEQGRERWVQFQEEPLKGLLEGKMALVEERLEQLPAKVMEWQCWVDSRDKKTMVFSDARGRIQLSGVRTSSGLKKVQDWSSGDARPLYNLEEGGMPKALRALECCNHVRVTSAGISFDRLGIFFKPEQQGDKTVYSCDAYPGYVLDEEGQVDLFGDGFVAGVVLVRRSNPNDRQLVIHAQELLAHEPGNAHLGPRRGSKRVWFDRKPTELEPGQLLSFALAEDGTIKSRKDAEADINLYLAYLHLAKRDYAAAARLVEKALTDQKRSPFYDRVAKWMATWEDRDPSGIAVQLKLVSALAHKDRSIVEKRKEEGDTILGLDFKQLFGKVKRYHRLTKQGQHLRRVELSPAEVRKLGNLLSINAKGMGSYVLRWYVEEASRQGLSTDAPIGDPVYSLSFQPGESESDTEKVLQAVAVSVLQQMDFDDWEKNFHSVLNFAEKRDGWARDFHPIYRRICALDPGKLEDNRELQSWQLALRASWPYKIRANMIRRLLYKAATVRLRGDELEGLPDAPTSGRPLGRTELMGVFPSDKEAVEDMVEWMTRLDESVKLQSPRELVENPFQEAIDRVEAMGGGEAIRDAGRNPMGGMLDMVSNPEVVGDITKVLGPLKDPARSPLTAGAVKLFIDSEQGIKLITDVESLLLTGHGRAVQLQKGNVASWLAYVGGGDKQKKADEKQGWWAGLKNNVSNAVNAVAGVGKMGAAAAKGGLGALAPLVAVRILAELEEENPDIDPNLKDVVVQLREGMEANRDAVAKALVNPENRSEEEDRALKELMEREARERLREPLTKLIMSVMSKPLRQMFEEIGIEDEDSASIIAQGLGLGGGSEEANRAIEKELKGVKGVGEGIGVLENKLIEMQRDRREREYDRKIKAVGPDVKRELYEIEEGGLLEWEKGDKATIGEAEEAARKKLTDLFTKTGDEVDQAHWTAHEKAIFEDAKAFEKPHHKRLAAEIRGGFNRAWNDSDDRTWKVDRLALRENLTSRLEAMRTKEADRRGEIERATKPVLRDDLPDAIRRREKSPPIEAVLNLWENDKLEQLIERYKASKHSILDPDFSGRCEELDIAIIASNELGKWLRELGEIDKLWDKLEDRRLSEAQRKELSLQYSVRCRTLHGLIDQKFYYRRGSAVDERLKLATMREEGFIERKNQLEIINGVVANPNKASQDRLGIGKSAVICKTILAKLADGYHLATLVAINEDLGQALKREDKDTRARFRRRIYSFDFGETSKTDSGSLREQLLTFKELAAEKGFMVTSKASLLLFRDKYIEGWLRLKMAQDKLKVVNNEEDRKKVTADIAEINLQLDYWGQSLVFLKEHMQLVCDEIDQILDPTDMVNLALSITERLDADMQKEAVGVISEILGDEKLRSMIQLLEGRSAVRAHSTAEEKDLLTNEETSVVEYLRVAIGMKFAAKRGFVEENGITDAAEQKKFAAYVAGRHDYPGVEELKRKIEGLESYKRVVILKEFLSQAFGVVSNERNTQYGRMPGPEGDVGPYDGAMKPRKGSSISDPFEWALCLGIDYACGAVSADQAGDFITMAKKKAFKANQRGEVFKLAEQFEQMFGMPLLAVRPEQYGLIADKINGNAEEGMPGDRKEPWERKLDFLIGWVMPNLVYYPYQVQGKSSDVPGMGVSCSGFSGTFALGDTMAKPIETAGGRDETVDGGAIYQLMKWAVDNEQIFFLPESDDTLETLMLGCRGFDGLGDAGAVLKNCSIYDAVEWMALRENMERVRPGTEWVQYIDPANGKWMVRPIRGRNETPGVARLRDEVTSRDPRKTFIFYDGPSTRGKDDRGFFTRKLLMTAGDKQRLTKMIQAEWRNRGLNAGQGLGFALPHHLRPILGFGEGDNPSRKEIAVALVQWLIRQEADYQVPNNFKGESHKFRGYFENRLLLAQYRITGKDRLAVLNIVDRVHKKSTAPDFTDLEKLGGLNKRAQAQRCLEIIRNQQFSRVRKEAVEFLGELLSDRGRAEDLEREYAQNKPISSKAKAWMQGFMGSPQAYNDAIAAVQEINGNRNSPERKDARVVFTLACELWENREAYEGKMSAEGVALISQALIQSVFDLASHEILPEEKLPHGEMGIPREGSDTEVNVMQMQMQLELEEAALAAKMDPGPRVDYVGWPDAWKTDLDALWTHLGAKDPGIGGHAPGLGNMRVPEMVPLVEVQGELFTKGLISGNLGVRELDIGGEAEWSKVLSEDVEPYTYVLHLYNKDEKRWLDIAISRHELMKEVGPLLRRDRGNTSIRAYVTRLDVGGKVVGGGRNFKASDVDDHRFQRDVAKWLIAGGCVDLPQLRQERAFESLFRAQPPQQMQESLDFAREAKRLDKEEDLAACLAEHLREALKDALHQDEVEIQQRLINAAARNLLKRKLTKRSLRFSFEELFAHHLSPTDKDRVALARKLHAFALEYNRPGMKAAMQNSDVEHAWQRMLGEEVVV